MESNKMQEFPYVRGCYNQDDVLHFSSDKKLTAQWYDRHCTFQYFLIGRYQVADRVMTIALERSPLNQKMPFPVFERYHIDIINETTLHLRRPGDTAEADARSHTQYPHLIILRRLADSVLTGSIDSNHIGSNTNPVEADTHSACNQQIGSCILVRY